MLRVVQDQGDLIELVRAAQSHDEPVEQLRERAGAQQLELPLLRLAQQRVVAADLFGERGEPLLQALVFALERRELRLGRSAVRCGCPFRLALRSAHRASILLCQARRSVTLRRPCR